MSSRRLACSASGVSIYEFPNDDAGDRTITGAYPKEFVVDYVRGYQRVLG